MDDLKDMQRTDTISKMLDNHHVRTSPFGENKSAERLYKRAERVVAAVHLLTNHIDPSEAARGAIRAESPKLLAAILDLKNEMRIQVSQRVSNAQQSIRYLISLTRILLVSGFISHQNASIMIEALDDLGNFLVASQRSPLSESVVLSRDELSDARMSVHPTQKSVLNTVRSVVEEPHQKDIHKPVSVEKAMSHQTDSNGRMSTRTESIVEVLRGGGALGIRDIAANLPEYSEKMIQRELLSLVARGKVRKMGLKRWSKYAIA